MKYINISFIQNAFVPIVIACMLFFPSEILAQRSLKSQVSIAAITRQELNFGSFTQGIAGGTVTIHPDGTRSATGDIILLNSEIPWSPAIFDVAVKPGTLVSVMDGPTANLTGAKAGNVRMTPGNNNSGNGPLIHETSPGHVLVTVGGTLTVGGLQANRSGKYTGAFYLIFIQE